MNFLTVQESASLTGKSESTIKRFIRSTRKDKPKKYNDSECFKFEKLPTGHEKTLISESFLREHYSIVQGSTTKGSSESLSSHHENTVNQEFVEHLKSELALKNQQISEKDKQIETLLERNKETNLLFAQLQQSQTLQIEDGSTKKRWWQRK